MSNPSYFGDAFKYLDTDKNLIMRRPTKYVHHDHTSRGMTHHSHGGGGAGGVFGDDLIKLMLLGNPETSQALILTKLLGGGIGVSGEFVI